MNLDPKSAERRLQKTSWAAVLLFSLLGLLWGLPAAGAVAAGGILAALNVEGLARLVHGITSRPSRKASSLAVLGVGFRYLLLGVGLFVIVGVWHADVVAVSVGLSAPVAAVVLEWLLDSMREFQSKS